MPELWLRFYAKDASIPATWADAERQELDGSLLQVRLPVGVSLPSQTFWGCTVTWDGEKLTLDPPVSGVRVEIREKIE
jgi:hypothetical protein